MNNHSKGAIAASHAATAHAGSEILQAGGNAFDAALAAMLASFVAESTTISMAGGGFMLTHTAAGKATLYDFFAQTPAQRLPTDQSPDFSPITLDFKGASQTFQVGLGAVAVPGNVAGFFLMHQKMGTMPLEDIAAPALALAKNGLRLDGFQYTLLQLLQGIVTHESSEGKSIFRQKNGDLKQVGDSIHIPHLYDSLYSLIKEGSRLFYEGEIGQSLVQECREKGGFITMDDLQNYCVIERQPLVFDYRKRTILTNPAPSTGGTLIAFALELLAEQNLEKIDFGSKRHLQLLTQIMDLTNRARNKDFNPFIYDKNISKSFLSKENIKKYQSTIQQKITNNKLGSTTHISVLDRWGNAASVTTSTGAGNTCYLPKTGIMLNNMLGEADLNPNGFHRWPLNKRISSMMSPSILLRNGRPETVLGSSGSSRIRTAIVQVISNMLDFGMTIEAAVDAARIHAEFPNLSIEPNFEPSIMNDFVASIKAWKSSVFEEKGMFFGGVNAVSTDGKEGFEGAADQRRLGTVNII